MFPNNYSPYSGLSKVFLVLVVVGALVGFAFTNSDLTNFITNSAKAEGIRQALALQNQKDTIDLQNYKAVEDAKTKAKLDQIEKDRIAYEKLQIQKLQNQARQAEIDLEMSRLINYAGIAMGLILVLCLGIVLVQFGQSRLMLTQMKMKNVNIWQDPKLRKKQIQLARELEREIRASHTHQTQNAGLSTFKTDQEIPILWEDLQNQLAEKQNVRRSPVEKR